MRIVWFFILFLCLSFTYSIDRPEKSIQYYLDNKLPFYLTGKSTQPRMVNDLPTYLSSIKKSISVSSNSVSYSAVSIFTDSGYRMAPLSLIISAYPIKLSDYTLRLNKSDFSHNVYDYNENKWSTLINNTIPSRITIDFPNKKDDAREFSSNFNIDRTSKVRLCLDSVKKYDNFNTIQCDKLGDINLTFKVKEIKISPAEIESTTSNLTISAHQNSFVSNQLNDSNQLQRKLLLLQSTTNSSINSEPEIFHIAEVMPVYPGGVQQIVSFLEKNVGYPLEAHENGLEGKAIVKFYIDIKGYIREHIVIK